jgi:hypothetical protein
MLTFEKKEDTNGIFEIMKYVLRTKLIVESLRRSNLIHKHKKYQVYGNTQKYCRKKAMCVKCVRKHHVKTAKKREQSHPKCHNCGEADPQTTGAA